MRKLKKGDIVISRSTHSKTKELCWMVSSFRNYIELYDDLVSESYDFLKGNFKTKAEAMRWAKEYKKTERNEG